MWNLHQSSVTVLSLQNVFIVYVKIVKRGLGGEFDILNIVILDKLIINIFWREKLKLVSLYTKTTLHLI